MVRNPYRRIHNNECGPWLQGRYESVWDDLESPRWDGERAALRIRWAARHACRRLRAERDEAMARIAELDGEPRGFDWEGAARALWDLLDDIDTLTDACKNSAPTTTSEFGGRMYATLAKRHCILRSDGYSTFPAKEP